MNSDFRFLAILAISLLTLSCTSSPPPAAENGKRILKSETRYRVTPEGEKQMEHFIEHNKKGQAVFIKDYMAGEIYRVHVAR